MYTTAPTAAKQQHNSDLKRHAAYCPLTKDNLFLNTLILYSVNKIMTRVIRGDHNSNRIGLNQNINVTI